MMHCTYAEPERYGQEESNGERDRDHLVRRMRTEHLRAERAPRDRIRVVALRVLTGPEARAGDGEQGWVPVAWREV